MGSQVDLWKTLLGPPEGVPLFLAQTIRERPQGLGVSSTARQRP